ncbi:MAG: hypothetical protein P4L53_17660 [Candidatus Obscuribacterales bacterium]|nr:hypothetical protein [Candidatus Obscuribacterales bacterium]
MEPSAVESDSPKREIAGDDGGGPPVWSSPGVESEPWFDECRKRIDTVLEKKRAGDNITEDVRCAFFVKANGKLDGPFVYTLGTPSPADEAALKIVRKAAPFKNPPAYLLNERRMLVTFSRTNGQLNSKLSWDRFDYTFVKPEDRLKDFQEKKRKGKIGEMSN